MKTAAVGRQQFCITGELFGKIAAEQIDEIRAAVTKGPGQGNDIPDADGVAPTGKDPSQHRHGDFRILAQPFQGISAAEHFSPEDALGIGIFSHRKSLRFSTWTAQSITVLVMILELRFMFSAIFLPNSSLGTLRDTVTILMFLSLK